MTTITAEAFAKNVERYLKEALQRGLRIVTSEGQMLHIGQAEALTENGLTPHEEEMLQRSIEAGEEDLRAGALYVRPYARGVAGFLGCSLAMYEVLYTDKATEGIRRLKRHEPQAYKKLLTLPCPS